MNSNSHLRQAHHIVADASASSAKHAALAVHEPGARMYLLARLIAAIEDTDQQQVANLLGCGFTPDLVQKLRAMTLAEANRFTAGHCGLAITVDPMALRSQIANVERAQADRQMYEYFIHNGATPRLMSSLFRVSSNDVRRMRKLLAPAVACGGRPRTPQDPLRRAVIEAWARICRAESSERQRFWQLHQQFRDQPIASLEAVVRPEPQVEPGSFARPRPAAGSISSGATT